MDPTGDLDRMVRDFKADNAERQKKLDEWRAFSTMMSEEIKAYGVKKVAEEIKEASDRMRKMDELRKIKNDKFPQHIIDMVKRDSCNIRFEDVFDTDFKARLNHHARDLYTDGWRCGRFTETGNQTLYRGESEAYVSIEVWSEVERLTKAKWDELHGKPIPNYPLGTTIHLNGTTYEEYKKALKNLSDKQKDRTQVTEVNEVPDGIYKYITGLKWSKVRSKGSRFLPSVNPLGDTGAFMIKYSMDWSDCRIISFRHKKGGSRG